MNGLDKPAYRSRWWILAAISLGIITGPIDASVVYIALPSIAGLFGVDAAAAGWVSMSYLLILSSFLLSFGRLGDMFGFKRIFLTGLLLFVATSALCGLAWNLGALIFFRALQAWGAGMAMAMGPAIITAAFPPEERGRALGLNGMVVALGLALGPGLGGTLVDLAGWRTIFYVNVPIGLAAYLWCRQVLPDPQRGPRQNFDWRGALLAFSGLTFLLLFASRGEAANWSYPVLFSGAMAALLIWWFIRVEMSVSEPMLDPGLFKNRVFSAGNIAALLHFMTQYVIVFLTPFFLQQGLGYSAGRAGITMTAFPLAMLVTAPVAGYFSDKAGQRVPAFLGAFTCATAAAALATLDQQSGYAGVAWRLALLGLGTGLFQSPNSSAVMGSVPKHRLGIAGGVLSTTRSVGMVFGIAAGGIVLAARHSFYLALFGQQPFLSALKDAYLVAALFSLASALACLAAVKREPG